MMTLDHQFIGEARDLLEQIGAGFLALEREPGDAETVRGLFRSVHTLKGASGIFERLAPLTRLLHAGEDVLDRVRDGQIVLSPALADVFLETFDQVLEWIDQFEAGGALDAGADDLADRLAGELRDALPGADGGNDVPAAAVAERPSWLDGALAAAAPMARAAVTYRPEPDVFFQGDDPLRTVRATPGLLWSDIVPMTPWPALDALDPFVANLEFRLLCDAGPEDLAAHFQYVERQVDIHMIAATGRDGAGPAPDGAARIPEGAVALLEELAAGLSVAGTPAVAAGRVASTRRILAGVPGILDDAAVQAALDAGDPHGLGEALAGLSLAALDSGGATENAVEDAAPAAEADRRRADAPRRTTAIKVDQDRLDDLMDMVGELVVVKNGLPFLAKAAEEEHGNKALSRQIRSQYESLSRVTNALQGSVMRMRMIPVGSVFNRFNRQVRDIARRLGKDITLTLVGEDTEADKTVVEELADPLVHLIRNACDHGLETAADRLAAGKPASGSLTLSARSEDDHVIIELRDDGRGIDAAAVRRKALEKGLLDEDKAAALSDREAINLILLPGFSTAETVSDLSGRGVGMDAVKAMVERRGGRLEINSAVGAGTTVRLAVPLSMALTRIMLFDVGGQQFGIPMAVILETRRVPPDDIHRVRDQECIVRRDRVITLKRLSRLLGLEDAAGDGPATRSPDVVTDPAVLLLNIDGQETGLIVDRLHEGMDLVVKPMEGVLSAFPIYAGTALLGDGRVLPVFNARELIRCL